MRTKYMDTPPITGQSWAWAPIIQTNKPVLEVLASPNEDELYAEVCTEKSEQLP